MPVTLQHTAAAPPLPRFGHELVEAFGHLMIFGGTAATGREPGDIRILRRLPPSPTPLAGPVLLDKQVTMQIHVGDEIDATAISGLASRYDPVNDVYGVHVADPEHPQGQRLLAMARGHLRLAEGPAPDDTLEWMADVPELSNSMVKNPSAAGLSEEYSWLRPSHRNAASLTRAGTRFVLFGGGSFPSVYLNDVWVLHTDLQPRIAPPPPLAPTVLAPHLASLVGSPRFADVKFEVDNGDRRCRRTGCCWRRAPRRTLSRSSTARFTRRARARGRRRGRRPATSWTRHCRYGCHLRLAAPRCSPCFATCIPATTLPPPPPTRRSSRNC